MERQEMDIEEGSRLMMCEGLFQLFDESSGRNNDGKRCKRMIGLTGANVLDEGTIECWMKRSGDDAKHQEP